MKATRIMTGLYHYRGWEIEQIEDHWNFRPIDSWFWTDAAQTLRECKLLIDIFEEA